jgi:hypothetical protein
MHKGEFNLHIYDFPSKSAYDLVHLSPRKAKMTFPKIGFVRRLARKIVRVDGPYVYLWSTSMSYRHLPMPQETSCFQTLG